MAKHDTNKVRQTLIALRDELSAGDEQASSNAETVELDQAKVGRLSRMDALQMQAMAAENLRRRQVQVHRIDAALNRLDRGEYGLCRECELDIAPGRLNADPAAVLCIDCANEVK